MTILIGDAREQLATLPEQSAQMCVTSPPYFGLRNYNADGQIGLEPTVDEYVSNLVDVFREVRRVLRDDGTLWLNLGDSYVAAATGKPGIDGKMTGGRKTQSVASTRPDKTRVGDGLKTKDLIGIPWRVAFALQADGWYLRQDIIWHKPNPMPESVRDRCTKSHEYIFLLSKSPRYYYDAEAIAEPVQGSTTIRLNQQNLANQKGSDRVPGKTNGAMKAVGPRFGGNKYGDADDPEHRTKGGATFTGSEKRNKRSVWTITTKPYSGAHFAVFPPELPQLCILAGSKPGDTVLDPFGGSGTTAQVADKHERHSILIELNPCNEPLIDARLAQPALWGLRS